MIYCPQCHRDRDDELFKKEGKLRYAQCSGCRSTYNRSDSPGFKPSRREKLDQHKELRVSFFTGGKNRKLGNIPSTMTTALTCPDACAFKDSGCFAEFGFVRKHWQDSAERGLEWWAFLRRIMDLPEGQVWRHNVAGDLPGTGNELDIFRLDQLTGANRGRRGFTYTHKPLLDSRERDFVHFANRSGFTVNLSADSLEDADRKFDMRIAPVAVVIPSDAPTNGIKTPKGRHVVVCPAETKGLTCEDCQLCAVSTRKSIVGFRAHGQWKSRVDQIVRLRTP